MATPRSTAQEAEGVATTVAEQATPELAKAKEDTEEGAVQEQKEEDSVAVVVCNDARNLDFTCELLGVLINSAHNSLTRRTMQEMIDLVHECLHH